MTEAPGPAPPPEEEATKAKLARAPSGRFKVLGWMVLALKRWQSTRGEKA